MHNPFATLEDWLKRIEANQQQLLQRLEQPQHNAPLRGGIELAQEITGLSKPRIYALVSARQLPHAKRGGRLHFCRAELLDWVKAGSRAIKPLA